MLQCSGLVAMPSETKLKFVPCKNQGFFANFNVVSQEYKQDLHRGDHHIVHYYQISMFIPSNKRNYWEKHLRPGEVFSLRTGDVSSVKMKGFTHPLTQIKTTEKNFLHLKVPTWHSA